ncbi:MAG: 50S ribosome-binding GTPase [Planctomycetes bacterium]|nr:50S ribosome-binding GTPase [Planctomycetota bacterium]
MTASWYRRLTGEGPAGLQVFALGGADLATFEERHLRDRRGGGQGLLLARLVAGDELVDEVLYRRHPDRGEISIHGGPAVARRLEALLVAAGFRPGQPVEARPGTRGPAMRALETARGRRQVVHLARLAEGAFDLRLREIADGLDAAETDEQVSRLREEIASLLERAPYGLAMCRPPLVCLRGPVNAGKSSLFNALCGRDRVIVSDRPGTTRDAIEAPVELDGFPFRLVDLAGERASVDPIELLGQAEGDRRLAQADIVLDLQPARDWARRAAERSADLRVIPVASRADEVDEEVRVALAASREAPVVLSTTAGLGLGDLQRRIVARSAFGAPGGEDLPGPFLPEQVVILREALRLVLTEPLLAAARLRRLCD